MGCWVGDVDQIGELVVDLGRHGDHLPPQPDVQRQVWTGAPIVLRVQAKNGLAKSNRRYGVSKASCESCRAIGEKIRQRAEVKTSAGIGDVILVEIYSLGRSSEF